MKSPYGISYRYGQDQIPPISNSSTIFSLSSLDPYYILLCTLFGFYYKKTLFEKGLLNKMRFLCFSIFLPIFIYLHIINIPSLFNEELMSIGSASFTYHLIVLILSILFFNGVRNENARGWLIMSTQGCLLSPLYPKLESLESISGYNTLVSTALLWDLFGNIWACQLYLFIIAFYYNNGKKRQKSPFLFIFGQPILISFILGIVYRLVLSNMVNMHNVFILLHSNTLRLICETFSIFISFSLKTLIYIIIGGYACFDTPGLFFSKYVILSFFTRVIFNLGISFIILLLLNINSANKVVLISCIFSPVSSLLIYIVGEVGFDDYYLKLSASLVTISLVICGLIQNIMLSFLTE